MGNNREERIILILAVMIVAVSVVFMVLDGIELYHLRQQLEQKPKVVEKVVEVTQSDEEHHARCKICQYNGCGE